MNFDKYKHIIPFLNKYVWDETNTKYEFEEKVRIINEWLKFIWNLVYNKVLFERTMDNDEEIKDLNIKSVLNWFIWDYEIFDWYDFDLYDNEDWTKTIKFVRWQDKWTVKLLCDYLDNEIEFFSLEDWIYTTDVEIDVLDINKYKIGDYVFIKDETQEIVCKIKNKTETAIVIDINKTIENWYLFSDSLFKNYEIICLYFKYYINNKNNIEKEWGEKTSESWTQGSRQYSVSFKDTWSENKYFVEIEDALKKDANYKYNKSWFGIFTI